MRDEDQLLVMLGNVHETWSAENQLAMPKPEVQDVYDYNRYKANGRVSNF